MRIRFSLITILWAVHTVAAAENFCNNFDAILKDATHSFVNLRGTFDFDLDYYLGKAKLDQFNECETLSSGGVAEYTCRHKIFVDDAQLAQDDLDAAAARIRNCFKTAVQESRRLSNQRVHFKYVPTDDDISVRYQRLVSKLRGPLYQISISVTAVDLSAKD